MNLLSSSPKSPFYQSDLDLDRMILVLILELDLVKMSHHTKNEVYKSKHANVVVRTDTQTDRQYENITFPHIQAVTMEYLQWPLQKIVTWIHIVKICII